jgi:hypothetical protein
VSDAARLGPAASYRDARARWASARHAEERRFAQVGLARLVVFGAGVALAILLVTRSGVASPAWMLVPAGLFGILVIRHERVARRRDRAARSHAYFERGLARLEHRWMHGGDDGARFRDDAHPFSSDLELFGPSSLFHLLSTCRTETAAARLASWLEHPADPAEVRDRQAAVRELAGRAELRHELAVIGPDVRADLDSGALRAWASGAGSPFPGWAAPLATIATTANLVALAGWAAGWWPGLGLAAALGASSLFAALLRRRVGVELRAAAAPARALVVLSRLLDRVAGERFESPWLARLSDRWSPTDTSPGAVVRRLARLVDLVDARRNQMFAPLAGFLVLGTHLALAIARWQQRHGSAVIDWLDAMGDLEAAVALATFAYEHPADAYPELAGGPVHLIATGLAHPLLPEAEAVRNDVRLEGERRVMVVSGSNMSGKTTLLKAIGVNLALAQAGAPVRASGLRTSPFAVGASLVLRDSLLEGRSRFFGEIVRLREIVAKTGGERPVLFLLDELLSGTNSHDRAIGAEAVIQGLVGRGAAGFVTTHDLALTRIAERLGARGVNCHFEDQLLDGNLRFDYRLKPGVVARSNALELMRSVGLLDPVSSGRPS